MKIKEIMTEHAECTRPDATLREAATRMKELDVGVLPVCEGDRLVGILTDRDIIIRAVSEGHAPDEHRVQEAMTPSLVYCFEDDDITDATRLMEERQIRRLPILNREKRLVGIVSLGDLAVSAHDEQLVGGALESISEPAMPRR